MTEKTGDGTESSHWGELEPIALGEKQCIAFIIAIEVKGTREIDSVHTIFVFSLCNGRLREGSRGRVHQSIQTPGSTAKRTSAAHRPQFLGRREKPSTSDGSFFLLSSSVGYSSLCAHYNSSSLQPPNDKSTPSKWLLPPYVIEIQNRFAVLVKTVG